jgi:hypothetical protein
MSDTELLKEMNGKLDDLLIWRGGLDERCKAHREQTDEVRDVLFANPTGLKSKVERLWNGKTGASRWKDFWMFILRSAIIFGILGIVGWLLLLYKQH